MANLKLGNSVKCLSFKSQATLVMFANQIRSFQWINKLISNKNLYICWHFSRTTTSQNDSRLYYEMQATVLKTNIICWVYARLFHPQVQILPAKDQEIMHKILQTCPLQPVPQLSASGNSLLIHGGSLGTWKWRGSSISISSSPSVWG